MLKTDIPQHQDLSLAPYKFKFNNMKIKSIYEVPSERDPKCFLLDHWQRKLLGCMRKCWKKKLCKTNAKYAEAANKHRCTKQFREKRWYI